MDKKLSDNEIVKALECTAGIMQVDCDNCPFLINKFCDDTELATATLGLINRQKAEIERMTEREKFLENAWHTSIEHTETVERGLKASEARNAELQKQVDELTLRCEILRRVQIAEVEMPTGNLKGHNDPVGEKGDCGFFYNCEHIKQAVKDTAKEIYSEIGDDDILVISTQEYGEIEVVPLERLQEIVKGKGVEVE